MNALPAPVRPRRAPPLAPAAAPSPPLRILIASHGHPAITRGGAEIAAYALFRALHATPGVQAWFLGCRPHAAGQRLGIAITQPFDAPEFVYQPGAFDWFKFANRDAAFPAEFRQLLLELRPDVIHFHHFAFFGVEVFRMAKQVLPNVRVVLTVHEYLLICNAHGQMVTARDSLLCYKATGEACHACFPERSPADFFLRATYSKMFLGSVDTVVAPSRFLAGRLAAWGLDERRLRVIENLVPAAAAAPAGSHPLDTTRPFSVGFFGQISRLKGIVVLLKAAALLEREHGLSIGFEIHGEYRAQPPEFQAEFLRVLGEAGSNVRYHGAYWPDQVDALMQTVDLVVVPSIWWENSPVVIQEALRNRRPVVCSNIGGMAEKVRDGQDGWHVPVNDANSLAALLIRLAANRDLVAAMADTMGPSADPDAVLAGHRALYAAIIAG